MTMGSPRRVCTENDAIPPRAYHNQIAHPDDLFHLHWPDDSDIDLWLCPALPCPTNGARLAIEPSSSTIESGPSSAHPYRDNSITYSGENVWSSYDEPWTGWRPHPSLGPASEFEAGLTQATSQWMADSYTATLSDDTMSMQTDCHGCNLPGSMWDLVSIPPMSDTLYHPTPTTDSLYYHPRIREEDLAPSTHTYYDLRSRSDDPRSRCHSPELAINTCHAVPRTSRKVEPASASERKKRRYECTISHCSSHFIRQADFARHMNTIHARQEQNQGYRCAFKGCSKADKIWTRVDSFKQHVQKWHKGTDVNTLVRKSSRILHGSDATFPFAVTTPATMSQKRGSRAHTRSREQ